MHLRPGSTSRWPRRSSRTTGTPPRRCPRRRWRWPPTRLLFGKRLHAETRIELFKQATDTRPVELKNQGVRPRVFFGERWITSIFDLFEENVRYFPTLLAETSDEDPMAKLEAGVAPTLGAAAAQRHDLPVEPAHLRHRRGEAAPAGREPSAPRRPDHHRRPRQRRLLLRVHPDARPRGPSGLDEDELRRAPRTSAGPPVTASTHGCTGPASVSSPPTSSCCVTCFPLAHEGLRQWGVSDAVRERYLGVIEGRCTTGGPTGPSGRPARCVPSRGQGLDRREALRRIAGDLRRAHGRQQTGSHLAASLTGGARGVPARSGKATG